MVAVKTLSEMKAYFLRIRWIITATMRANNTANPAKQMAVTINLVSKKHARDLIKSMHKLFGDSY